MNTTFTQGVFPFKYTHHVVKSLLNLLTEMFFFSMFSHRRKCMQMTKLGPALVMSKGRNFGKHKES